MTKTIRKTASPSSRPLAREAGYFGYRKVDPKKKAKLVKDVFDSVAPSYDLMNDLMSGGIHRLWKRKFVALLAPKAGEAVLDVAGGTGDIAFLIHKSSPKTKVTLCDINESMLRVGRDRAIDRGQFKTFRYVVGNAEALPIKSASLDAYTISFGLRNVTDIDAALREAARVLKPGGRFFCLEFSRVKPVLRPLYDIYSFAVLPALGKYVARDAASYQYLAESIRQFPPQEELAERMSAAGLSDAQYTNLSGGIAAIHQAVRK